MPLVLSDFASVEPISKPRLLICQPGAGASPWFEILGNQGYAVKEVPLLRPLSSHVRSLLSSVDIALLDLTTSSHDVLNTIYELNTAIGICNASPRLLAFSSAHRNPQFVLKVEKAGARYVRVAGSELLLDAIEALFAEMGDLESNGPSFEIVHRFARGNCCLPGEEISAVVLPHAGKFFQLPLGLAQRFVFDLLAQRHVAVDSLQIVSALASDRFFVEHAANSGQRQAKKIRRATVKVLIQRTRESLAATFAQARLKFDPSDVLRSCHAEGSKRVLYKLRASVRWRHISG